MKNWRESLSLDQESDNQNKISIVRPMSVDLFLSGSSEKSSLPVEISSNPILAHQAKERRELYGNLGNLFEDIKDLNMDVDEAIDKRMIKTGELTKIYDQLSDFIEEDENNTRIILYLPFQLLPNFYKRKKTDELTKAQARFKDIYRDAWIRLIFESEPRANFVEGDVLEKGMGRPERIRKAAHLTPNLLEKGILTAEDVIEQFEMSQKEELDKSLLEGLTVAKEKNLISKENWKTINEIRESKGTVLRLKDDKKEERYSDSVKVSEKRIRWEKGVIKDRAIEDAASNISEKIQRGEISKNDILNFFQEDLRVEEIRSFVKGIGKAGEDFSTKDLSKAQDLAKEYWELIKRIWKNDSLEAKNEVISLLSRWRKLEIISDDQLKEFEVNIPDFSSPFPVKMEELEKRDLKMLRRMVRKIKNDPDLSKSFYPFLLVFGSKIKGYAALDADLDLALFVKPEVTFEERDGILETLSEKIPQIKDLDKVLEFWVEEKDGELGFREAEESETIVGELQIHFLLGGAWLAEGEEHNRLHESILKNYLNLSGLGEQKEAVRSHLLGQIELDVLQCRLMHKGYRKFYPNKRDSGTENSNLIDWNSDFWDPGYRRIATQLFLSRVFLPDLSLKTADESVDQ